MLIEFSVGNYRSFRERVTLSLLASPLRDDPELDERNVFQAGKLSLLRSAAIYGANASGKSNLVRALMTMRGLVLNSATKIQAGEKLPIERFRLDIAMRQHPAWFQIVFLLDGKRYRYGFQADEERIHSEWLYHAARRETRLFAREGQEFEVSTVFRREATPALQRQTRPNALLLSVLAQFNGQIASQILDWFRMKLNGIIGLNDIVLYTLPETTRRIESDERFRQRAAELIHVADTGILGLKAENAQPDLHKIPAELHGIFQQIMELAAKEQGIEQVLLPRVQTRHAVFDGETKIDEDTFEMSEQESEGTQKFFALLGPLLDALEKGMILVIDELEARLHPLLTREIVRMFNDPRSNPQNAQLLFVTHDAGLLGECLLRRDQVWFAQKNRFGATELYSLAEMKERKGAAYLKNYLNGRYGGIPLLGGLRAYIEQELAGGA